MAYVTSTTAIPQRTTGGFFDGIRTRFAQYRLYTKTINELRSLSVRELNDLGISPGEIRRIALEAAYGQ